MISNIMSPPNTALARRVRERKRFVQLGVTLNFVSSGFVVLVCAYVSKFEKLVAFTTQLKHLPLSSTVRSSDSDCRFGEFEDNGPWRLRG